MDRFRMETPDLVQKNIEAIGKLFPNCITETRGEDGAMKRAVNFDMLRQMLTDEAIAGDEAYEFTWVGKKAAMVEASRPVRKTLRPCKEESKDWDTTENLYIEGDNLDVLKLLQESYLGKVKMIYIDPPYNTGHDFIYRDSFARSRVEEEQQMGMFDEETEEQLFENTESNGRFHSDWCSMMYPRLMLARNILADDGALFISIDDNEANNLIKLCEEVFGEECLVANISWQRTYSPRNDSQGIVREVEHLIVFSKQAYWTPNKLERTEEMDAKYKNPDNDVSPWTSDNPFAPGAATHQGMVYAIQHPFTGEMLYPSSSACWRYQQDEMLRIMNGWCPYILKDLNDAEKRAAVCGISPDEVRKGVKGIVLALPLNESKRLAQQVYERGQWPRFYFTKEALGGIRRKTYLERIGGRLPTNLWLYEEVGHTDEAKKEVKILFDGSSPFDTPKPTRLIEKILKIATEKESLVMDFFSGSATTAHAVFKANAADGGRRRFILVQLQEKTASPNYETICEIGKERIRRAGEKIKSEAGLLAQNLDVGFRVLKLDETNMKDVYYSAAEYSQDRLADMESNIKEDRTDLDLLYGCLLEWALPLSLPYSMETIDGCTVHTYGSADPTEKNVPLKACFDENVPESVVRAIADRKPLRVVFRDSSFASSPERINVEEIFKLLAPNTSVRVI